MKRNFSTTLFLAIYSFSNITLAEIIDQNNGCGSGWNEVLVPDKIAALGINFESSCATHDNCYGACNDGGIYSETNRAICDDTDGKSARRAICDQTFQTDMRESCNSLVGLKRRLCELTSTLYYVAVRAGGIWSFNGKEVERLADFILLNPQNTFDIENFRKDLLTIVNQPNWAHQQINIQIENNQVKPSIGYSGAFEFNTLELNGLKIPVKEKIYYGDIDITGMNTPQGLVDPSKLQLDQTKLHVERFNLQNQKLELSHPAPQN